ncbi:multidrug effflux MFS transporter [Propionivibrio sp.]|uniref:multidrug effflux MFS transporter n=1 Tax=Propionivibrio sp. TaxID=2212460 RepID=UPI00262AC245|nr:multidrug effflux MFS transporter [Propionivibrio sp.]
MPTPKTSAPRGIALMLAALSALGPFSIDTYLPSFHDIGQSLRATPIEVQQTLTAYLIPFAIMALWHGAISDAFGRRRVILVTLALFGLSVAGCLFATRIEHLWVLRALQGMSAGAGIVISRAIVRDLYDGPAAHRLMSHMNMMFALAPAVAPLIGGRLQAWFGWRSVFAFLVLATLALWLACWHLLPETLPSERRQSLHLGYLARTYWKVLSSPAFLFACGGLALNFAGFFIYVMSAPVFLMRHLGVSETGFLWLFGPAMVGLMAGSWLSGRLAGKLSLRQMIARGYLVMGAAALGNVALNLWLPPVLPWSVAPILVYTFGMSLAMPCLTLLALDPFPMQRGLAASCQMFLQAGSNGLVAGVLAPALWGSTLTLALGMGALMLLGATSAFLYRRFSS